MTGTERLYGLPGDERLYFDPVEVYETGIDPNFNGSRKSWVIEEWTVHPPQKHLPTVDAVIEWLIETAADNEVDEDFHDHLEAAAGSPGVLAAAQTMIEALSAGITYRMADKKTAEHVVTWDLDEEPLLDGKPMYVKAPTA